MYYFIPFSILNIALYFSGKGGKLQHHSWKTRTLWGGLELVCPLAELIYPEKENACQEEPLVFKWAQIQNQSLAAIVYRSCSCKLHFSVKPHTGLLRLLHCAPPSWANRTEIIPIHSEQCSYILIYIFIN